ncbi:MAG TPA: gamma-glutamyl-gamma-aminobutyrate hydrolase family protein, partial [Tepidisphaeraceae bacterium]|nr:gamma-glutamyl-gamma-aminobutyrate hydrolase family protein [Tepidisphaeraceae bacterium]
HQFVPDLTDESIEHRRFTIEEWSKRHDVELDRESILANSIGATKLAINSSHKQSINKLGDSLAIKARSPDGIVEMIEDRSRPFYVGVQWHPERMLDDPMQLRLFELLVEAARTNR